MIHIAGAKTHRAVFVVRAEEAAAPEAPKKPAVGPKRGAKVRTCLGSEHLGVLSLSKHSRIMFYY